MLRGDDEVEDGNLLSWNIVSVGDKLIEIDLNFDQPLQVSQGDESDKLIVQVDLSQFPDEHGARLPISVNRIKDIPIQVKSKAEAEAIADAGSAAHRSSAGTCAAHFILNLLL